MSDVAFLVFTDSSDHEETPAVVGPFTNENEAWAFAERLPGYIGSGAMYPRDGGCAAVTLACAGTAETPDSYVARRGDYLPCGPE